jgi:ABC-type antimicrobial peptide transport system permease subunit
MALGASRTSVAGLILGQGIFLVLAGIGIGLVVSVAVSRVLSRLLYGVSATDPLSMGAAAAVLMMVALVACYLPARGATRVDPLKVLREA